MRRFAIAVAMAWSVVNPTIVHARDLGFLYLPIHQGKITSSVLYEYLKVQDDFDTRGRSDFRSHVAGSQISFGINDQIAIALKGGVFVDPEEEAQGSRWQSRAGYLYGIDLYNEVFPATSLRPGVQISGGVSGFQVPLDRLISPSGTALIDQRMSGIDYHGSVVATWRWNRFSPYAGIRVFERSFDWRDNQPAAGEPATIHGKSHGNISVAVGVPVQLTKDVRFQIEGIFVDETVVTAGFTLASF